MSSQIYKGAIVGESLEDKSILKDFKVLDISVTEDLNPEDRWHIYKVEVNQDQLEKLSKIIKPQKWYAHFWDENKNIIAVFRDKIFTFNYDDKESWGQIVQYGISVGIPKEQLDFLIS